MMRYGFKTMLTFLNQTNLQVLLLRWYLLLSEKSWTKSFLAKIQFLKDYMFSSYINIYLYIYISVLIVSCVFLFPICFTEKLKRFEMRLASAFGHGDLSQRVAERIGRIYGSDPFGVTSYRGEAQLHGSVTKANLNVRCRMTYVDIPIVAPTDDGETTVKIVPWPALLPRDMATALAKMGHLELLTGSAVERLAYWEKALLDFPSMSEIDKLGSAPLAFYGDECQVFRQSVMCFHWQAALSPVASNSLISRYLISIVPSEYYWVVPWSFLL